MKKLTIPNITYQTTDAEDVGKAVTSRLRNRNKQGFALTLSGAFKHCRVMPVFAALGDYVILSLCIETLNDLGQTLTEKQVKSCLRYFEDYDYRKRNFNNEVVEALLLTAPEASN